MFPARARCCSVRMALCALVGAAECALPLRACASDARELRSTVLCCSSPFPRPSPLVTLINGCPRVFPMLLAAACVCIVPRLPLVAYTSPFTLTSFNPRSPVSVPPSPVAGAVPEPAVDARVEVPTFGPGTVRFVGELAVAQGRWVGVELDEAKVRALLGRDAGCYFFVFFFRLLLFN